MELEGDAEVVSRLFQEGSSLTKGSVRKSLHEQQPLQPALSASLRTRCSESERALKPATTSCLACLLGFPSDAGLAYDIRATTPRRVHQTIQGPVNKR